MARGGAKEARGASQERPLFYSDFLRTRILQRRSILATMGSLSCGSFLCSYNFTFALAVLRWHAAATAFKWTFSRVTGHL